jgi:hypothetical protein
MFLGRGIPNVLGANNMAAPISPDMLPCPSATDDLYFAGMGSRLTQETVFGRNPFSSNDDRRACELQFNQQTPDLQALLSATLHDNYGPIQEAVLRLIDLTRRIS